MIAGTRADWPRKNESLIRLGRIQTTTSNQTCVWSARSVRARRGAHAPVLNDKRLHLGKPGDVGATKFLVVTYADCASVRGYIASSDAHAGASSKTATGEWPRALVRRWRLRVSLAARTRRICRVHYSCTKTASLRDRGMNVVDGRRSLRMEVRLTPGTRPSTPGAGASDWALRPAHSSSCTIVPSITHTSLSPTW
jgi:hypothetical protein